MRRPANVFLLAILIATFTATLVYRSMRNQSAEIEAMRRAASRQLADIVVADAPIPIGTRIEAAHVRVAPWPADIQPDGAIADSQLAIGSVALTNIARNQPVLKAQITSEGSGLLPLMINEGMRGMSVKVDNVTGVSGFITPNSRVDVLVAGSPDGMGQQDKRSRVVLQNVRVLATGKSIEQQDEKPVEVPTVTLLVSPKEAEQLTLATSYEPVRLALRNYRDTDVVATPGVSAAQLFAKGDGNGNGNGNGHVHARPKAAPPSVEVYLGSQRTLQSL